MKLHSQEFAEKKTAGKEKLQNALSQVLSREWTEYHEMHHAVNQALGKDNRGRQIDIEFVTLGQGLKEFDKETPLEWRYENTGAYPSQRVCFVRIMPNGGGKKGGNVA